MSEITRDELHAAIEDKLCAHFGTTGASATDEQVFLASAQVIREIMSRVIAFQRETKPQREVHYLSMEYLLGRSLMKNAYNLGIGQELAGALEDMGRSAADIFELEPDAGLGNGGLGRLAACYSDSWACSSRSSKTASRPRCPTAGLWGPSVGSSPGRRTPARCASAVVWRRSGTTPVCAGPT